MPNAHRAVGGYVHVPQLSCLKLSESLSYGGFFDIVLLEHSLDSTAPPRLQILGPFALDTTWCGPWSASEG